MPITFKCSNCHAILKPEDAASHADDHFYKLAETAVNNCDAKTRVRLLMRWCDLCGFSLVDGECPHHGRVYDEIEGE